MLCSSKQSEQPWVPVVSSTGKPLMPCRPVRARKFIQRGRAVKKWNHGFFYIQMLDIVDGVTQPVAIGVDPGSKMEAYTVKAAHKTFLNIQSHARDGNTIKKALETRANARRARRYRHTPCRAPRWANRSRKDWLPPSTKARWQLKLNIINLLRRLYPVTAVVIEDVKAVTKEGKRRWNSNFSPIQAGKNWLYSQLEAQDLQLIKKSGMETYTLRQIAKLPKTSNKLATVFSAHCVDSWVLANSYTGGHIQPDNTNLLVLKPLSYSRRQLHRFNPAPGGTRSRYGGTMSLGFKKGTLVSHPKYGKCLVGGCSNDGRLSLHSAITTSRLCRNAKPEEVTSISFSPWVLTGNYNQHSSVKLERKAYRVAWASLRSQLRGWNFPPP